MIGEEIVEQRKERMFKFIKQKTNWISYLLLGLITYIAVYIRTRNMGGLKDITTGTWTLGPDLDPFLFLRWAKYIVSNGTMMVVDKMRYVPLGYNTAGEMNLHTYMIVWLYKILHLFSNEITITYSAVIFPVIMFALTIIAFFFLVREIFWSNFKNKQYQDIIALISCFFLSVISSLLPRTIAGIPEKESAAFFFMFLAFYFFLRAWRTKRFKPQIILAILSGITTAFTSLIWGGYGYIFMVIGATVFISFLIGKVNLRKIYIYSIWILSSFIFMYPFCTRYSIKTLLTSINTGSSLIVLIIMLTHLLIYETKIKNYFNKGIFEKIPKQLISTIISISLFGIGVSFLFGFDFIYDKVDAIYHTLVKPATSRLIQTVAENRQPYFTEWSGSFGPFIKNIPLFFWLFFVGSIYLFSTIVKKVVKSKERIMLTLGYIIFLIAIVFSRYSGSSLFNGENSISLCAYFGGAILFGGLLFYYYLRLNKEGRLENLKSIIFGNILLLCFFVLAIVSARGMVRLIMVLVPPTSIIIGYFIVSSFNKLRRNHDGELIKIISFILIGLIIVASAYSGFYFYKSSVNRASGFYPSQYQWQWQKAMAWVRDNTQEDAVFGHWWDYGYWIQSIGERATVLDGGNTISYWNHLMGREVLTSPDDGTALEFLYAHNTTHYLIDSTEIGKYGAYSKIGSNMSYDRISYIPPFLLNEKEMFETKKGITYVYPTNIGLDDDFIWEENGTKYFFVKENSGIGAIILEEENGKFLQPKAIFVNQNGQFKIPLKYVYSNGKLEKFDFGIEAGVFFIDRLEQEGEGLRQIKNGAGFYLSKRTVKSFLVRKYLFGEENNFKLVHTEPNYIIGGLRSQGLAIGDFVYFQGQFLGPIKIWEINYPKNIKFKEEYLSVKYPAEIV